jgi:hypothetical protein
VKTLKRSAKEKENPSVRSVASSGESIISSETSFGRTHRRPKFVPPGHPPIPLSLSFSFETIALWSGQPQQQTRGLIFVREYHGSDHFSGMSATTANTMLFFWSADNDSPIDIKLSIDEFHKTNLLREIVKTVG